MECILRSLSAVPISSSDETHSGHGGLLRAFPAKVRSGFAEDNAINVQAAKH
ncbi:hypothetical protein CEV31_0469 [Brucella thiophenivorans]|uniref:Uncharacterized protein n=1 Tax=Brucella thiophenivorans TaxID=571255 RepID=A0A256G593_9HYPH|nr:hypothetical protein CEV31_0469 [Brucella thiophenivorans]